MPKKDMLQKLTNRESEVMQVIWSSDEALTANEIFELLGKSITLYSVQAIVKSLLSKDIIKVDSFVQSGKTISRRFAPVLSSDEYAANQYFSLLRDHKRAAVPLVAELLGDENIDKDTLEELEQLIDKKKKEIE